MVFGALYKPVAIHLSPGDKPKTLIQKYDTSGDGEIGPKERRLQKKCVLKKGPQTVVVV